MLRYFFDEHLASAIAIALRARGIDAVTAQDVGRANLKIPDAEQLAFAAQEGRVLVTLDFDFVQLASTQLPQAGVIIIQQALTIGECIEYLDLTAQLTEPEEMQDRLLWCDW